MQSERVSNVHFASDLQDNNQKSAAYLMRDPSSASQKPHGLGDRTGTTHHTSNMGGAFGVPSYMQNTGGQEDLTLNYPYTEGQKSDRLFMPQMTSGYDEVEKQGWRADLTMI